MKLANKCANALKIAKTNCEIGEVFNYYIDNNLITNETKDNGVLVVFFADNSVMCIKHEKDTFTSIVLTPEVILGMLAGQFPFDNLEESPRIKRTQEVFDA